MSKLESLNIKKESLVKLGNLHARRSKSIDEQITNIDLAIESLPANSLFSKGDTLCLAYCARDAYLLGLSGNEREDIIKIRGVLIASRNVKEAINIANNRKSGFIPGGDNFHIGWDHDFSIPSIIMENEVNTQGEAGWLYFRSAETMGELLDNPDFVRDWKLIKGID